MNFLDTSILVSAAQTRHVFYEPCRKLLSLANIKNTACCLYSLAETYAILSGMPLPHKLRPSDAERVVQQVRDRLRVVSLTENEYAHTIEDLVESSRSGGIIYDALFLQCARKVGATRIYSLNAKYFKLIAPDLAHRIFAP